MPAFSRRAASVRKTGGPSWASARKRTVSSRMAAAWGASAWFNRKGQSGGVCSSVVTSAPSEECHEEEFQQRITRIAQIKQSPKRQRGLVFLTSARSRPSLALRALLSVFIRVIRGRNSSWMVSHGAARRIASSDSTVTSRGLTRRMRLSANAFSAKPRQLRLLDAQLAQSAPGCRCPPAASRPPRPPARPPAARSAP